MKPINLKQLIAEFRERQEDVLKDAQSTPEPDFDSAENRNLHRLLCCVESDLREDMIELCKYIGLVIDQLGVRRFNWHRGDLN